MALGVWEPYLSEFFGFEKGDCFFDVGAHIGYYTVKAGREIGPTGLVVAIEPDPRNLMLLRTNIANSRLSNVTVISDPVCEKETSVNFVLKENPLFSGIDEEGGRSLRLKSTTIDRIVETLNVDTIHVMKVDIESGDCAALIGGKHSLEKTRRIIIEASPRSLSLLLRYGFEVRHILGKYYLAEKP